MSVLEKRIDKNGMPKDAHGTSGSAGKRAQ
jgi:hypothetical protein